MSDLDIDLNEIERRMKGALDSLKHEFSGLRTGRASASLLDTVVCEVYGSQMPINQVGTVTVPEARMLSVNVWDSSNVSSVEKAIRNSNLGLNPMIDGQTLRIPIPELNEERRRDLAKVAGQYAEQSRIAIRNVRRDGMDTLKKMEKEKLISEDDHKVYADEVQELTNKSVKEVDAALASKEQEIMQV
ncbi:ribosome recycling factor [Temperatibacter marinus]|uniref:Ribosome-recycling factor n=1 Tax=Temperatibacter marinus TaxID=1456591 RepID=A0AA52ECX3_9PROT|nr:ribosome recycling factor [Temperatibacter marinus]WND02385.1 ribosome recycling factor [Temperatibacter marinus]